MCSVSSGVDAINSQEVLRGPSVGIVSALMQDHLSSMALVPQLQLWHFHGWCVYSLWATCICTFRLMEALL